MKPDKILKELKDVLGLHLKDRNISTQYLLDLIEELENG